jgi:hypothetical protein
MVSKALLAFSCAVVFVASGACAGPLGKGEGDSCTSFEDCSSNLTCQPIGGRQDRYCCPTPSDTSSDANCHAASK